VSCTKYQTLASQAVCRVLVLNNRAWFGLS